MFVWIQAEEDLEKVVAQQLFISARFQKMIESVAILDSADFYKHDKMISKMQIQVKWKSTRYLDPRKVSLFLSFIVIANFVKQRDSKTQITKTDKLSYYLDLKIQNESRVLKKNTWKCFSSQKYWNSSNLINTSIYEKKAIPKSFLMKLGDPL